MNWAVFGTSEVSHIGRKWGGGGVDREKKGPAATIKDIPAHRDWEEERHHKKAQKKLPEG